MDADETRYKLIRLLEANPGLSQRELATRLGVSLGKANYCLQALIRKGWIKADNFKNSKNRSAYLYLLTPRGIEEKSKLTVRFLQLKMREHKSLLKEIEKLKQELEGQCDHP